MSSSFSHLVYVLLTRLDKTSHNNKANKETMLCLTNHKNLFVMVKEHEYILLPRFKHVASIHTPSSHLLLWKLRNMHDLSLLGNGNNATLP